MTDRIIPIVRASLPPARDLAAAPEGELVDRRGRRVRDLRISVTDRCNFRCVYCMPKEVFTDDYAFLPRASLLSFEEIERIARVFVDLGVEKIRITGGEPLLRRISRT
jgi:cyclic pyranopterin phosphate synthase